MAWKGPEGRWIMPDEPKTLNDRLNERLQAHDPDLSVDSFLSDYRKSIQYDQILTFLSNIDFQEELKTHQSSMRKLTGWIALAAIATFCATAVNIGVTVTDFFWTRSPAPAITESMPSQSPLSINQKEK